MSCRGTTVLAKRGRRTLKLVDQFLPKQHLFLFCGVVDRFAKDADRNILSFGTFPFRG